MSLEEISTCLGLRARRHDAEGAALFQPARAAYALVIQVQQADAAKALHQRWVFGSSSTNATRIVSQKRSRDAGRAMWKQLWQKWTIDRPAAFGDLLWEVLVVQFAAWLDRLTVRQVIAFIPVAALILAYLHHIPVHPGLMLMGDLLAYIDIFSMIFLLGILSRATTILFVLKQSAAGVRRLARGVLARMQRLDIRHRRERGAAIRKRPTRQTRDEDDIGAVVYGIAWA
jgi:hypothetical protein